MGKVFTITEGLENMGALRSGGQGSVYKARRTGPITVAVKLLPTPIHTQSEDDKHYKDFINEVEKLKKVNEKPTPHVVKILSSGLTESGSLPFIEMEFIEGPDLGELLKPPYDPVFTIHEVIKVANQLANALSHCHRVGVKHGDIKSNNVKFNIHTGNYMLLDFGLAIMTNEQRRDSLRNAGAVEFMAPEQNEGIMLPQTDVYSYGIILYELLAGVVPFPLTANAQTARHNVMIAHMEAAVPNLLKLRKQNMPANWSDEQTEQEMQVPQWLLNVIDRCLKKDPAQRFADGTELQQIILTQYSALTSKSDAQDTLTLQLESLQASLLREQEKTTRYEQELAWLKQTLIEQQQAPVKPSHTDVANYARSKGISLAAVFGIAFLMVCVGVFAGRTLFPKKTDTALTAVEKTVAATPITTRKSSQTKRKARTSKKALSESTNKAPVKTDTHLVMRTHIDTSKNTVQSPVADHKGKDAGKAFALFNNYAYFHDRPDAASVRKANINRWNNARLTAIDDINGYIYVIYQNDQGQVSKGWLDKKDLIKVN